MISILSTIIGVVAKGAASKAIGGAIGGAIATQAGPLVDVFAGGVLTGATPAIGQAGELLGQLVIGGAVAYAVTWLAPANKSNA